MSFADNYTRASEAEQNPTKKSISDDSYAVCEYMELLAQRIEHAIRRLNG